MLLTCCRRITRLSGLLWIAVSNIQVFLFNGREVTYLKANGPYPAAITTQSERPYPNVAEGREIFY